MAKQPNLWFSSLTIRVEDCKSAHKRPCATCGQSPNDDGVRRLEVEQGSGRRHKMDVYCMKCGDLYLKEKVEEAQRAVMYLRSGNGSIRRA